MNKKFLIVTNTFYPDRNSASKLLEELSKSLINKNIDVLIVCARSDKKIKSIVNYKKIKINNVYCKNIKNRNLYLRGIAEFSISKELILGSSKIVKKYQPTNIICYSPPIFFTDYINYLKKNYQCKSFLILRDIFPFWAISTKVIKNYFLSKYLIYKFKSFVEIFDCVGVEAKFNIKYLKQKNIWSKKIIFLPNWIKNNKKNFYSKKVKYNNYVFGGNIGLGQDIKKVCLFFNKLALLSSNIRFKIIGKGFTKSLINSSLSNLVYKRIKIYDSLEPNIYDKELKNSSYGIVSLDDRIESVNFPGRMLNYIKLGLPVILLTNKSNELTNFIIKKKIGVIIGDNTNISSKLKILKKIKKNFLINKYNLKIISKYFNVNNSTKEILNNFEKL